MIAADGILERLKSGTANHHHSIENAIPILSETLTGQGYLNILKKFYGFHKSFEETLARSPQILEIVPDFEARKKLKLLQQDLEFLGVDKEHLDALPVIEDIFSKQNAAKLMGAFYVMEGSTLGGQFISRHLQERFGMTAEKGAAYYNAYGPNTGRMWQQFKNYLKDNLLGEDEKKQSVLGAQQTFTALQAWMS